MSRRPASRRRRDTVRVLAAVVKRDDHYLVGRRPRHKRHGGMWEFPGGKVRDGESDLEAVRRELAEELALSVVTVGPILDRVPDVGSPFLVVFVEVEAGGKPKAREHDELRWADPAELAGMPLAPSDALFVRRKLGGG